MQPFIRPIPEPSKFTIDFAVRDDGGVAFCFARYLQGRQASAGAVPAPCPVTRFAPQADAVVGGGMRNASLITSIVVTEMKP